MSRIKSAENASTELALVKAMRAAGISGWRRHVDLLGRPDFIFPLSKLAVFVDGCFWHGCARCYAPPKSNKPYWREKIAGNMRRDRRRRAALRRAGWSVMRIWEHTLKRSPATAAKRIRAALEH